MSRTAAVATHSAHRLRRTEHAFRDLRDSSERVVETARQPDAELLRHRPEISGWSAAEHLEHLGRSDLVTYDRLDEILDDATRGEPVKVTLIGRLVLFLGWIPRGRGRSPKAVRPSGSDAEMARELVARAQDCLESYEDRLDELASCPVGIRHPYFGVLDPVDWLRFLPIHHRHHLKIVRDLEVEVR